MRARARCRCRCSTTTPAPTRCAPRCPVSTHVVYVPEVSARRFDAAPSYAAFHQLRRLVVALAGSGDAPRLFIVTRNAQAVADGERANPAHAVLWGQGRTLALEHPEFWGGLVDVDETLPPELLAQYLHAEVSSLTGTDTGRDDQAVYRGAERRVPRLVPHPLPAVPLTRFDAGTSHLVIGATGNVGPYLIRQLADMGAGDGGRGVTPRRRATGRAGRGTVGPRHHARRGRRRRGRRDRDGGGVRPLRRRPAAAGRDLPGVAGRRRGAA